MTQILCLAVLLWFYAQPVIWTARGCMTPACLCRTCAWALALLWLLRTSATTLMTRHKRAFLLALRAPEDSKRLMEYEVALYGTSSVPLGLAALNAGAGGRRQVDRTSGWTTIHMSGQEI